MINVVSPAYRINQRLPLIPVLVFSIGSFDIGRTCLIHLQMNDHLLDELLSSTLSVSYPDCITSQQGIISHCSEICAL